MPCNVKYIDLLLGRIKKLACLLHQFLDVLFVLLLLLGDHERDKQLVFLSVWLSFLRLWLIGFIIVIKHFYIKYI